MIAWRLGFDGLKLTLSFQTSLRLDTLRYGAYE